MQKTDWGWDFARFPFGRHHFLLLIPAPQPPVFAEYFAACPAVFSDPATGICHCNFSLTLEPGTCWYGFMKWSSRRNFVSRSSFHINLVLFVMDSMFMFVRVCCWSCWDRKNFSTFNLSTSRYTRVPLNYSIIHISIVSSSLIPDSSVSVGMGDMITSRDDVSRDVIAKGFPLKIFVNNWYVSIVIAPLTALTKRCLNSLIFMYKRRQKYKHKIHQKASPSTGPVHTWRESF